MKTIISTISILAGGIILHSCRESDIEEPIKLDKPNLIKSKTEMSKNNDTIQASTIQNSKEPDQLLGDPPVRHGGQWKFAK